MLFGFFTIEIDLINTWLLCEKRTRLIVSDVNRAFHVLTFPYSTPDTSRHLDVLFLIGRFWPQKCRFKALYDTKSDRFFCGIRQLAWVDPHSPNSSPGISLRWPCSQTTTGVPVCLARWIIFFAACRKAASALDDNGMSCIFFRSWNYTSAPRLIFLKRSELNSWSSPLLLERQWPAGAVTHHRASMHQVVGDKAVLNQVSA